MRVDGRDRVGRIDAVPGGKGRAEKNVTRDARVYGLPQTLDLQGLNGVPFPVTP